MDYSYYNASRPQPYSLYGLPTPDQQPGTQTDDAFADSFPLNNTYNRNLAAFDPSLRFDASSSSFAPPPGHSPPDSFTKQSVSSNEVASAQQTGPASLDHDENAMAVGRSSSEEKESMIPMQNKRKAQNRAAQRAFRERKERHVRELEEKVTALEQESSTLQADNERLKRELAKYATENEILRATSQHSHPAAGNSSAHDQHPPEPMVTGPMKYSPTDFYSSLMPDGTGAPPPPHHRITFCQVTGEKLLDAGATWDLIQNHGLFKLGKVDIGDVTDRLKGMAQCDGQGPAFKEGQVRQAIEESVAAGRDELI
ncbi:hypothetical protein N7510_010889 [Penicillium lagena]|uniref:uncharacterized protein n=1 Tax=Penicillium lagena TaxID=94218 RepID=UPI002541567C|nr:uncharacterized protein N7510_010889 [Penicillium lagena]KAJ5601355.1 hypothetical protein N7510_010889 [Penicillium lagena]